MQAPVRYDTEWPTAVADAEGRVQKEARTGLSLRLPKQSVTDRCVDQPNAIDTLKETSSIFINAMSVIVMDLTS
ncbi:hypothetical protein NDU88_008274 [Pleurodeles waltl]|uniref:Uncharacterized protein n=1 Tax=Pleurodeles waltl TaxID=8319 RepID=A0AAV7QN57_PLEWA|nr:hypothetical protein NDU88_008274 [Pleurodeles waltl]